MENKQRIKQQTINTKKYGKEIIKRLPSGNFQIFTPFENGNSTLNIPKEAFDAMVELENKNND